MIPFSFNHFFVFSIEIHNLPQTICQIKISWLTILRIEDALARSAAYWTSITWKGCSGALTTCQHQPATWQTNGSGDFFAYLSTRESGSCVTLEEFNEGSLYTMGVSTNLRPRMRPCSSVANFACEGDGPLQKYIGDGFNKQGVMILMHNGKSIICFFCFGFY